MRPELVFEDERLDPALLKVDPAGQRWASAVVAARRAEYGSHIGPDTPGSYAIDNALNHGNSGGPIIAIETGDVHAVCTRFQPVPISQPHLRDGQGQELEIRIPSLYGYVSALENAAVVEVLLANGVRVTDD